jgi:hypothetical protein
MIAKYGVMSSRTVWELLDKRVSYGAVRKLLNRLEERGLLVRPTGLIGGQPAHYWMLSKERGALAETARLTMIPESALLQSKMRYTHFPHEDLCTLFQFSVECSDPRIKVLRNKRGIHPELPDHLISATSKDLGYCPDLCLGIPHYRDGDLSMPSRYVWLAVEIDRSYRTTSRLARRLNVYTKHTGFAGVLYFMPSRETARRLHEIYGRRVSKDAFRLIGSQNVFVATAPIEKSLFSPKELSVLVAGQEIALADWFLIFSGAERERRDHFFETMRNDGVHQGGPNPERQVS